MGSILYFAEHQIGGDVVMPVALPPEFVFCSGRFRYGLRSPGLFIAAFVTVVTMGVVRLLYVRDRLGKRD